MRTLVLFVVAALALGAGCTSYVELQNTGNRIWIMSKDGKEVYRCYDMTPEGTVGHNNAVQALCQQAAIFH